ncbi:MAG TPA: nickel pincer cofactor biosynthesis protein LarC, partial [Actinomycetota bacterium]|nr:nickel pincer cofactor biosynthesis protein LarC [Actinomycetota bacterium]
MTVVYFDCFAGAAGDMLLGALVDAGAPSEQIRDVVARLHLGGQVDVEFREVVKAGLRATKADVTAPTEPAVRTLPEIRAIIERAGLEDPVAAKAQHVFDLLARAEARVHGAATGEVHLHEAGMADSIIDVVGTVAALHHFNPTEVVCSGLPLGRGVTRSAHGTLPVPGPAVLELLRGVPVVAAGDHETVTPTGAALLVGLSTSFGFAPPMIVESVGYGAGSRDTDYPNVVRALVGSEAVAHSGVWKPQRTLVMEANLDDLNPEVLPYAVEQLIVAGAQDAWVTPILMKKGRPAFTLSALIRPEDH